MRLHTVAPLVALALVATSATVVAQTTTAVPPQPIVHRAPRAPDAHLPLLMAYRTLGVAEAFGASGHYLDAARSHYRSALARLGNNDQAGAGAEARLAADLAHVALAERPAPTPHDLPPPPAPAAHPPMAMGGPMDGMGPHPGGWGGGRGPGGPGGAAGRHRGGHEHGVSLAEVGALLKLDNTPEVHELADAAFAADQAADKAAFTGDRQQAARQHRIAGALGAAVRDLAQLDHPELRHRGGFGGPDGGGFGQRRGPGGPGGGPPHLMPDSDGGS
jgi:hypothetical protein